MPRRHTAGNRLKVKESPVDLSGAEGVDDLGQDGSVWQMVMWRAHVTCR